MSTQVYNIQMDSHLYNLSWKISNESWTFRWLYENEHCFECVWSKYIPLSPTEHVSILSQHEKLAKLRQHHYNSGTWWSVIEDYKRQDYPWALYLSWTQPSKSTCHWKFHATAPKGYGKPGLNNCHTVWSLCLNSLGKCHYISYGVRWVVRIIRVDFLVKSNDDCPWVLKANASRRVG